MQESREPMSHQPDTNQATPFDLKLCAASFMAGALFVLMPFLYVCHQCHQHSQTETMLRYQLLTEHYNQRDQGQVSYETFSHGPVADRKATCNHTAPPTGKAGTMALIPDKPYDYDESKP